MNLVIKIPVTQILMGWIVLLGLCALSGFSKAETTSSLVVATLGSLVLANVKRRGQPDQH